MTIPRPRRHYSTARPWKSPRQTILLSPGFVNELKLWYKNYARTAPLPEVTASASDEGDYYDITKMFTTNASAATDGPEVASLVDRPAAISYRSSPASHRKPSLQMSGKSLRIIDDCPVLIVQLMRTARKMPTLIIAPDDLFGVIRIHGGGVERDNDAPNISDRVPIFGTNISPSTSAAMANSLTTPTDSTAPNLSCPDCRRI
ncbi:hypothetical protein SprV_0401718400 [Sparganum proliferum]